MSRPRRTVWCLAIGWMAALVLASSLSSADVTTEDFRTTQHRDGVNSTAWWDTTTGRLALHPFQMELLGAVATHGFPYGCVVAGDVAYVATQGWGMQVVDVSDPTAPSVIGDPLVEVDTRGIDAEGNYVYLAGGNFGLSIINVSDPSNPSHVFTLDTPLFAGQVDVWGDYAYVADMNAILVIDVSNPAAPAQVGQLPVADAQDVVVDGPYAYVADRWQGLVVVSVDDPTSPAVVGGVATPEIYRLAVDGHLVYSAHLSYGMRVIDVSDPTAPSVIGSYNTAGSAHEVAVSWPHAYVADGNNGIVQLDVSDVTAPVYVGTLDTDQALGIELCGERAWVCDAGNLESARIASVYPRPGMAGNLDTSGEARNVTVTDHLAYVADGNSGMHIMDISDPANPQTVYEFDTSRQTYGIDIVGNHAYLADHQGGLGIIDVSDPTAPATVSWTDIGHSYISVTVVNDYAYLGDIVSGFYTFDISNPASPQLLDRIALIGQPAYQLVREGDFIYAPCAALGLVVFNINNRAVPDVASSTTTPHAYGIAVEGDLVYLGDRVNGLHVFDVTNPYGPVEIGSCPTPGIASGLWACGDYVFLADDTAGVETIDVSDPTNPVIVGTCDTPGHALGLTVVGDHAYVASLEEGLQVVRVFDRDLDVVRNIGQSSAYSYPTGIEAFRVESFESGNIAWEVSIDGGFTWEDIVADNTWVDPPYWGDQFIWRAVLAAEEGSPAPACDSLVVELEILVPVFITSFDARAEVDGVHVAWEIFADEDIAGFKIYRREDAPEAPERPLQAGLLPQTARDFVDTSARPATTYWYRLGVERMDGRELVSPEAKVVTPGYTLSLRQNVPNPFNPSTQIAYSISRGGPVALTVHEVGGRRVSTLVDRWQEPGSYSVTWDGTDDRGRPVAAGVYFCRLTSGNRVLTRKMVMIK